MRYLNGGEVINVVYVQTLLEQGGFAGSHVSFPIESGIAASSDQKQPLGSYATVYLKDLSQLNAAMQVRTYSLFIQYLVDVLTY